MMRMGKRRGLIVTGMTLLLLSLVWGMVTLSERDVTAEWDGTRLEAQDARGEAHYTLILYEGTLRVKADGRVPPSVVDTGEGDSLRPGAYQDLHVWKEGKERYCLKAKPAFSACLKRVGPSRYRDEGRELDFQVVTSLPDKRSGG